MTPVAETERVAKRFGDLVAVDGVTFTVQPGEIVGLLGANGAGKTTVIKMMLGLVRPHSGRVRLFGGSVDRAARRRVGYLPQTAGLYEELTVSENLAFNSRVFRIDPPEGGSLDAVSDRVISTLPLGVKRRVGFAAATGHSPEFLVLDEPTSGVDPAARTELWDSIHAFADRGAGVLVTTHYMDEAEQCDRLVVMSAGREVASGTVEKITAGIETVVVTAADVFAAAALLEEAGLAVLPTGRKLRLPGADPDQVAALLNGVGHITTEAATLEESFVVLSVD